MNEPNQQERNDASRKANFIEKNAELYQSSPIFKMMVDNTIYLRDADRQKSMSIVGAGTTAQTIW